MMASKSSNEADCSRKLKPTLDNFQKRFSCARDELLLWRNCLLVRYSSIEDNNISIQYNDFDKHESPLTLPSIIPLSTSSSLSKSVIRVLYKQSKCVTITLYFNNNQAGGTLLCQGVDCPTWDCDECEMIRHHISSFLHDGDHEKLLESLLNTPLSFISAISGTLSLKKTDLNLAAMTHEPEPLETMDSAPPTPPQLLLEPDCIQEGIIILPPTPPVNCAGGNMTHVKSVDKHTPVATRTRYQSRRSMYKNPTTPPSFLVSISNKISSLSDHLDCVSSAQTELENKVSSVVADVKVVTRNELRVNICDKFDLLVSKIDDLNSKIENLEKSQKQLGKENNSIKSQLGSIISDIKELKPKNIPSFKNSSSTQTESCQTMQNDTVCNVSVGTQTQVQENQSVVRRTSTKIGNRSASQSPRAHLHVSKTSKPEQLSKCSEVSDHSVQYNVATSNSFSMLSEVCEAVGPPQSHLERTVITVSDETHQHNASIPTPHDILKSMTIPRRATMLLVGDSVIRFLNPKRLAPREEFMFKICVPDMTVKDLLTWLQTVPITPNLKYVTVHVGINSCPAGPVSHEAWSELISLCSKKFPGAHVAFSSIIPAKGKSHFNNSIVPSNRSLQAACDQLGVSFINHTPMFVADSDLYSSKTHPNARGTASIAKSIKSLWNEDFHFRSEEKQHAHRSRSTYEQNSRANGRYARSSHTQSSAPPPLSSSHYPPLDKKDSTPPVSGHPLLNRSYHMASRSPQFSSQSLKRDYVPTQSSHMPSYDMPVSNQFGPYVHPSVEQLLMMASHILKQSAPLQTCRMN